MKSHHRWPWQALLVVGIGAGLMGCHQEGGDTRNIVDVVSLNDNGPLFSDVYNFGDDIADPADDFVPIDVVEVIFSSRPHDDILPIRPDGPFGTLRFHTYDLVYGDGSDPDGADLDGDGNTDLFNFTAPMNVVVPINGFGQGFVLIVSGGDKITAPVGCLGPLAGAIGGCGAVTDVEFAVNATITFHATEQTSGDDITATRGLLVRIGQFGDD